MGYLECFHNARIRRFQAALLPEMAQRIERLYGYPAAHAGLNDSHEMRERPGGIDVSRYEERAQRVTLHASSSLLTSGFVSAT